MRNASLNFKDIVQTPGRQWDYKVKITLSDGYTVYNIKGTELVEGGIMIHDTVSESTEFKVGGVSTRSLKLGLINFNEKYTNVSFEGAEVEIYIGMVVEQNWEKGKVWEWINFGNYTCEGSQLAGLVVWLPLFARTFNFDESYSRSKLQYPATLRQILEDARDCCGITLMTHEFTNDDYVVDERPDTDRCTFRHVIFDLLQLAGCYMRFDEYGRMCLGWYDEGAEPCCKVEYPDMWTFDVIVTGIRSRNYLTDEEVFVGTEDYVLDFTENVLAQNNLEQALKNIGKKIFGFSFRPFEGAIHADPSIEAGDPVLLIDRKGREYRSYAMEVDWTIGKPMELGAYSKTVRNNNSNLPSNCKVAISESKKAAERKINIYDTYAKQFAAMTAASVGYFTTTETLEDGSQIVYSHDKKLLSDSKNIWKKNGLTVAVSNDGGKTWRGIDKDGNAVLNDIAAKTIVADKIVSGRMQTADGKFYLDLDTGESTATNLKTNFKVAKMYPEIQVETILDKDDENHIYGMLFKVDGKLRMGISLPGTVEGWRPGITFIHENGKKSAINFGEDEVNIASAGGKIYLINNTIAGDGLTVMGNFDVVNGTKSRVVGTSEGDVRISAYETAEPYFGDIGEGTTDEKGQARIELDPLFAETVNTSCPYQVFLQPYALGSFYVAERAENFFIVRGEPNSKFGYEIKAKQKGYEDTRLENINH